MDIIIGRNIEQPKKMSLTQENQNVMVSKTPFLPKVEIHKFDGRDVRTQLNQLEW